jgi:battenin
MAIIMKSTGSLPPLEPIIKAEDTKTLESGEQAFLENSCTILPTSIENSIENEAWSKRNILAFFNFGLVNNFAYVIMLSAAEKILENGSNRVSPGVILLCDTIPSVVIKYLFPWFGQFIPYWLKIMIVAVVSGTSFILVGSGTNTSTKLIGITMASLASGFGEPTFLGLTSFYEV